ncbi:hypothetical protein L7F22_047079 [Adiantum nelumboides]|nr:hypothetical protein [Adiantum nelumboides]
MNPRQGKWVEFLSNFHMVIQYVSDLQNAVADALSRMPKATNFAISDVQMEIPACLKNEYLTNKDFEDAFRALKSLNSTLAEMNMFASYTVMDELLYYLDRICVPHNGALRKILIQEHHGVPFGAHPGTNKTYRLLSATYFWPQMQQDVIKYVKACHSCQIMEASRQLPQGLLQPLRVPKERWESISMDFITTLPRTTKGNGQILVIVDRFSKLAHFISCKKAASAPDIASLFVQHIFTIHELPRSIISDRGPKFTGHFWTSLFKSPGTNLLFNSAYHLQTDGQIERVNQILEQMLRHYIQQRLASWEEYLPLVEFAYNNASHSVIGMRPFQAAYGHTPLVPTNFVLQHKVALAYQLVQEMQDILVQVRDKLIHVQQKYQKQANKHRRHAEFNEGDLVLLLDKPNLLARRKQVNSSATGRIRLNFTAILKDKIVNLDSYPKANPKIKICGVTNARDATLAAQAGASFVGMILWPKSKRSICVGTAKEIAHAVRLHKAEPVGVFVDEDAETIDSVCSIAGIQIAQLHGERARASLTDLPSHLEIIYVAHVDKNGFLQTPLPESNSVDWILLDSLQGGSGNSFDWEQLKTLSIKSRKGWLLAGGLNSENVVTAISMLKPDGVDVSSGVTMPDGLLKDPARVVSFIDAVKGCTIFI